MTPEKIAELRKIGMKGVTECLDKIERLQSDNQRLTEFAEFFANCPCCQETVKCDPECTFREDVNEDDSYQRMVMARIALSGHHTFSPTQ